MKKTIKVNGEVMNASQQGVLAAEQFLQDRYLLRRNVLNGKVEFAVKPGEGVEPVFRALTLQALNSIIMQAKREDICEGGNPKSDIQEYINSEDVATFDPIQDYLNHLPQWDGQNHVAKLFSRIPGLSSEQLAYLFIWMRSMVAHWLQMDTLHGNEVVPTLIGAQGCGKTTFFRRLLPQPNNLLVNLDELDAIRPSQHAALKQTLSKNKVNGRPIYGTSQEDRPRYASFVSSTNNRHPLTDATGSRRYICMTIPDGQYIDNTGDIDYDQLYAQVLYELCELQSRYWFTNDEVARIQDLNLDFMEQKDMAEMISVCFRKPKNNEVVKSMNSTQMLQLMQNEFSSVKVNHSSKVQVGFAMKELGYAHSKVGNVTFYKVVPLIAA